MWMSTLDLNPRRALTTSLLGRFWRGAYFTSFAPLQVRNLPRQPLPAPDWVRVRNRLAGICGSDLQLIYLKVDPRVAPAALGAQQQLYPGHEVVGEVIEVGEEVQTLRVGDTVVLQYGPNCLTAKTQPPCRACAAGECHLCERLYQPGPVQIGSGWSEEMLVHERQLFRLPEAAQKPGEPCLSDEQAVMLEPTAVALHAVLRRLPQPGERVLIIGAGTIGLLTLQAVRALATQVEVDVMARHAFQVERATRLGATHMIYSHESYKQVARITGAELVHGLFGNTMLLGGYDVIYDTVGSSRTITDALRWTRSGGTVVLVGLDLHLQHVDLTPVWYREIDLVGSLAHGQEYWPPERPAPCSTFALACDLISQGLLAPEQLITHRFALTDYRHALTTAVHKAQTRAIKVIFDYALQPASVVPNVRAARVRRLRQPAAPVPLQLGRASPALSPAPASAPVPTSLMPPVPEAVTEAAVERPAGSESTTAGGPVTESEAAAADAPADSSSEAARHRPPEGRRPRKRQTSAAEGTFDVTKPPPQALHLQDEKQGGF